MFEEQLRVFDEAIGAMPNDFDHWFNTIVPPEVAQGSSLSGSRERDWKALMEVIISFSIS